jgi:HEAT repeat protein
VGRKRHNSTQSAPFTAVTKELINSLEDRLTDSDEEVRRTAVAAVLDVADEEFHWRLAERLVARLAGDDEALRQRAAASLTEMGPAATGPLILRHHKARSKALQQRLCEVLVRIADVREQAKRAAM